MRERRRHKCNLWNGNALSHVARARTPAPTHNTTPARAHTYTYTLHIKETRVGMSLYLHQLSTNLVMLTSEEIALVSHTDTNQTHHAYPTTTTMSTRQNNITWHLHAHKYACTYTWMYTCTCTQVPYVHTRTHTHTHSDSKDVSCATSRTSCITLLSSSGHMHTTQGVRRTSITTQLAKHDDATAAHTMYPTHNTRAHVRAHTLQTRTRCAHTQHYNYLALRASVRTCTCARALRTSVTSSYAC
jgi:hypothetical protein